VAGSTSRRRREFLQYHARGRAHHGVLFMADDDSFDRYVAVRSRFRRSANTEKEARQMNTTIERQQAAENRALRQMRSCGAKTRAGHPCRRKGRGRGGRCPNHGGASTGPMTNAGRQRIAAAQRKRWQAWRNEVAQN
jgi:hypothetical protein